RRNVGAAGWALELSRHGTKIRCEYPEGNNRARCPARPRAPIARSCALLVLRLFLGFALAYVVLALLAWLFQDRLAFPAPRGAVPEPGKVGIPNGERITLTLED